MAKTNKIKPNKNTSVKVNNKNYNRQVKKGKIKPKSNWSFQAKNKKAKLSLGQRNANQRQAAAEQENEEPESDADITDMLEPDDDLKSNQLKLSNRKRGVDVEDNILEAYEKKPRFTTEENIRYLLPIKNKSGLIPQQMHVNAQPEDEECELETDLNQTEAENKPTKPLTYVEMYVKRKQDIADTKERVGVVCSLIVEDPEENIHKLKELIAFLNGNDPGTYLTYRKVVALSLVEVFKDILPSYKIRPVDAEEKRLKKETKKLQDFEQATLKHYKLFLTTLESWIVEVKSKKNYDPAKMSTQTKIQLNLAVLALKCYSELIISHPHFNYASNIIKILVDRMPHKVEEIATVCCDTMSQVFKNDRVGEISWEAVKQIRKLMKMRNYDVPINILKTFLNLNVKEALVDKDAKQNDIKKIRQKMLSMSRKEKQRAKKMKELEREMLEARAEESKQKKSRLQTDILENVFVIYFHIVKNTKKMNLLTPVMEGLSRFAHLINIDFFNDLINALYKLMKNGDLGTTESLHCLKTVFTILSGQGDSLNIDPQGFYIYLYKLLLNSPSTYEDTELLLDCIDVMITQRRKKITLQRLLAFTKRICTLALNSDAKLTMALLVQVRQFMQIKQVDVLLETEKTGSGVYRPDVEDPEHCNANAAYLTELEVLQHHSQPYIKQLARHILLKCPSKGEGALNPIFCTKTPKEIFKLLGKPKNVSVDV